MKKLFALAVIFTLVLAACKWFTDDDDNDDTTPKLPSLTIQNESSYVLTDVKFSGISFAAPGYDDLPVSSQSVKELTANDVEKTGYITFVRKDIGIACRTEAITITDEDYIFTFHDNRLVEELENLNNRKSLAQITFLSKVTLELGGLIVPRSDIIDIEGFANYTKQTEFTLKNTGVGKLLLTGTQPVKITGTGADAFSVIQPTSSEIAPDSSLRFRINFRPDAIQDYNATVTINSNDQDGDFVFTIRARGAPPRPIASVFYENSEIEQTGTIDAGEVLMTLSKSISVTIKNTGAEVLTLDTADFTINGADAGTFTKITNPAGSISAGGQTSFVIECRPTKQGENNVILSIPTNDNSRNPVVVYLKVTGVRGSAVLGLTQTSTGAVIANNSLDLVGFGRVEISSYQTLSFTIKNTGNIVLNLSETLPITSTNAVFAIVSQPITQTFLPGASTTFTIRFTPIAEEDATAFIDIPNDSDEGIFRFAIVGTGYVKRPQITIAYNNTTIAQNGTIDAGEVILTLSKNIIVTIKNTGEQVLTVDTANITITGENTTAFTKTTNPGASISVGTESSFVIKCEPVVQGENNAILTIPSNDNTRSPVIVYLKMTAVRGSGILSLSQNNTIVAHNSITPFNFGQTALNTSISLVFTIKNNGSIPLVLTGDPAVVSSNDVFAVTTQPTNTSIDPAATVLFIIEYTPTVEQEDTGTITIENDSNDTLFILNVKGTGYMRKPQITVFHGDTEVPQYSTIKVGDVLISQPKDVTVIIKNIGEELLTVNTANVTITGTTVFTKATNPAANVSVGGQTQFVIRCAPTAEGEYQATLTIPTNDSFRTPYIVYLQANAVPVIYKIGDTGPAGGIIFFDAGVTYNGWRYLEASLFDQNAGWGGYGYSVAGTGPSIGAGKQNTQLIVAVLKQRGETVRAAQLCADLDINGFKDWFLPSSEELNLLYQRRSTVGGFSTVSGSDSYYWSSSQYNSDIACYLNFNNGYQYSNYSKTSIMRVRAIRAFK